MTPQTPPTDRPLTAGDVPLLREGDLIKGPNGKTYRFEEWGDGGFLTFIDEPFDGFLATLCTFVSRPATSAASEEEGANNPLSGSFATVESIGSEEPARRKATVHIKFEGPDAPSKARKALSYLDGLHAAALASPPVSERERELSVLLDNLVIAQSLSRELRTEATDQARAYLYDYRHPTAQPAGEGK